MADKINMENFRGAPMNIGVKSKLNREYTADPEWYTYYHGETLEVIASGKGKDLKICAKPTPQEAKELYEEAMSRVGKKLTCLKEWIGPVKIKDIPPRPEEQPNFQ